MNVKSASVSVAKTAIGVTSPNVSFAASRAKPESGRAEKCPGVGGREGAMLSLETTAAAGAVAAEVGVIDVQRLMIVRIIAIKIWGVMWVGVELGEDRVARLEQEGALCIPYCIAISRIFRRNELFTFA